MLSYCLKYRKITECENPRVYKGWICKGGFVKVKKGKLIISSTVQRGLIKNRNLLKNKKQKGC